MIILHENEWAAAQLADRDLGEHPSDTMRMIARYYIDMGMNKGEIQKKMEEFLLLCRPAINMNKWKPTIEKAYQKAMKYPAVDIDNIPVTQKELDVIASLPAAQQKLKRIAFTLLCLSKYWTARNPDYDYWVCTQDSDVMKIANVRAAVKQQCLMYHSLKELGLIQLPRKVDGKNVRICFADPDGDPVLLINDFRNLGYQYLKHLGQPFFTCECCGIVSKQKKPEHGRKQKYCEICATRMKIQNTVNAMMRRNSVGNAAKVNFIEKMQ